MRKILTFMADAGEGLTLDELSKFVSDAEEINFRDWTRPIIEVAPQQSNATKTGQIRKITVSRSI